MMMLDDPPNETDEEPPPLVVVVAFVVGHADGVVPLHPDVREQVVDVKREVLGVGGGASAQGFEDCGTGVLPPARTRGRRFEMTSPCFSRSSARCKLTCVG